MQVVVLMGGRGERLSGITAGLSKAMVDIQGKPFFYYQLQLMAAAGLNKFVFCVGYQGEAIKSYFKDGRQYGINIRYLQDGYMPLGTAGALRNALPLLEDEFMVAYGDTYLDVDYAEIMYMHSYLRAREKTNATMVVYKNNNRFDRSNVIFERGRILRYDKFNFSPAMRYIDSGITLMNKRAVRSTPAGKFSDLSDVYKKMVAAKQMSGYEVKSRFYEIGRPAALTEFKKFIRLRESRGKEAIFLDRDGTLNRLCFNRRTGEIDSPLRPEELRLLPRVISALQILKSLGYLLIVVTNQPAAAKGKTSLLQLYRVNNRFKDLFAKNNIFFDDVLICPHYPLSSPSTKESFLIKPCSCRKPKAGMLNLAIKKFNIKRTDSYIVGDSHTDILAGEAARLKTVLLGRPGGIATKAMKNRKPDHLFENLFCFANKLRGTKNNG